MFLCSLCHYTTLLPFHEDNITFMIDESAGRVFFFCPSIYLMEKIFLLFQAPVPTLRSLQCLVCSVKYMVIFPSFASSEWLWIYQNLQYLPIMYFNFILACVYSYIVCSIWYVSSKILVEKSKSRYEYRIANTVHSTSSLNSYGGGTWHWEFS